MLSYLKWLWKMRGEGSSSTLTFGYMRLRASSQGTDSLNTSLPSPLRTSRTICCVYVLPALGYATSLAGETTSTCPLLLVCSASMLQYSHAHVDDASPDSHRITRCLYDWDHMGSLGSDRADSNRINVVSNTPLLRRYHGQ